MNRGGPEAERKSFFEQRPWLGAAIFGLIIVVTGITLVNTIGVRPHFRGKEWKLVTNLPPAGTGSNRGPALALLPEEFRHSPVTVVVFVTLKDDLERPCGHIEVALVSTPDDKLLSYGVTEPRAGTIHLPVPASYDPKLFRGEVEARVMVPGMAPIRHSVPQPRKGAAKITVHIPTGATVPVVVRRFDGAPFTGEAWVRVWPLFCSPPTHARGIRVLGGKTRLGGLPFDEQLVFSVRAEGYAEGRHILRFSTKDGTPSSVRIHLGPRLADLSEDGDLPAPRLQMNDLFRCETLEESAGDPSRKLVVQFSDGIPAGAVKVVIFSSGNPLLSQVNIRARIGSTSAEGTFFLPPAPPGEEEPLVLAHTADAYACGTPTTFPFFLELMPLGSANIILHGLPRAEPGEHRYVTIEDEASGAPIAARWWLRSPPQLVSSLGRCHFEGLLPGSWTVRLTTIKPDGSQTERQVGAFEIPETGGETVVPIDL